MGILQRVDAFLTEVAKDYHGVTPTRSTFPTLTFDDYAQWMTSGNARFPVQQTMTGETVSIDGSFGGYASAAYAGNGIVFACMQVRFMLFSEARFQFRQLRSGRPGDLFGLPSLQPLETPWPGGTTGDLLSRLLVSADLSGNGFVVKNASGGLRIIRPDWVTMVWGSPDPDASPVDTELVALLYHDGGKTERKEPQVFVRGEFAHFAPVPDPMHPIRGVGMSWLTPILREIRGDTGYTIHKLKFLDNGATVNMVVNVGGNINDKQFADWIKAFESGHRGAANAYRTLYLTAGTTATPVGSNMEQMDFKAVQGAGETRIAAAAGVPPVVVGFSEGLQGSSLNAGNYSAARRRFADLTMRPLWRNVAGSLASLVPPPPGAELWYDDRDIAFLQEDVKDAAEIQQMDALTIRQLVDAGFKPDDVVDAITAGDLRRLVGKHTGFYSVQLQELGATAATPARALSDLMAPYIAARSLEVSNPEPAAEVHVHQPDLARLMTGLDAFVQSVEARAAASEQRSSEAIEASARALQALAERESPVVHVSVPEQQPAAITFAPEVRVDVPQQAPALVTVNVPDRQTIDIASMPPAEATVVKGRDGKTTGIKVK